MIRCALGLAGVVLIALAVTPTAIADMPAGPRLAFLQLSSRPVSLTIATSDPALGEQVVVAGGGFHIRPLPFPFSVPAWSPDGSLIAFSGIPGSLPGLLQPQNRRLYLVGADRAYLRAIPGTRGGFDPVFSPDGTTLAFAKTVNRRRHGPRAFSVPRWKGVSTWSIGLDGHQLHQLTEWRNGVEDLPSSFSPDGSVLTLTHRDLFGDGADALALRLDDRSSYLLSKSAAWPRYSPDGDRSRSSGFAGWGTRHAARPAMDFRSISSR